MTKVRADIVCEKSLYQVAKMHNFSDFLYVGRSEIQNHGNTRPAIMADSVEALIAAIYLQEKLQIHGDVKIEYKIIKEEGPDHNKKFTAIVSCNGNLLAQGEGRTKKNAEMEAARKAIEKM